MKTDTITKILLTFIALFLGIIALAVIIVPRDKEDYADTGEIVDNSEIVSGSIRYTQYVELLKPISEEGQSISTAYSQLTQKNSMSDFSRIRELDKIISRTEKVISNVKSIQPPSNLVSTHEKYLRGWNSLLKGFLNVRRAFQLKEVNTRQAVDLLREANDFFDDSALLINEVADELGL